MITTNERAVRMIEDTPEYYHYSKVYNGLQQANAEELDLIDAANKELSKQLDPKTATWGLKYWEERLGLPVLANSTDYLARRKKVLARIRSGAPFSAAMIKAVVEAYTEKPVQIKFDIPAGQVKVAFDREFNASTELFTAIDNIIHAHLGVDYTGEWVYERTISHTWDYDAYKYAFTVFANAVQAGTTTAGTKNTLTAGVPSTLGRYLTAAAEMARSTYTKTPQPIKYASTLIAGGTEVANTSKAYSAAAEATNSFTRLTKAYTLCGTFNTGTGARI